MNFILNIDTAVQSASVCLAAESKVIATLVNPSERDAAAWLHPAIEEIVRQNGITLSQLKAVAVSAGPGSYTGLRVGMAAAKGLCYALSLPLISINTLQMMAASVENPATQLLCPMIDARRMEVFTALYDPSLQEVMAPTNLILEQESFDAWLNQYTITFLGNGSGKAASLIQSPHAVFVPSAPTAAHMVSLSWQQFEKRAFSDLAYSEPYYGKEFYAPLPKKKY